MLLILGFAVVVISAIGGLMIGGGNPTVLLHASEFIVVLGICFGILIVASPWSTLKAVFAKTVQAFKGGAISKERYLDLMKMMYQVFMIARREGVIALEDHVMSPYESELLAQYPAFLKDDAAVAFFCNSLRPVVDGKVKPEHLKEVIDVELEAMEKEAAEPVHVLALVGDSFPGVGICAAVLGIILTMGSIAEGAEAIGYKVAAALTGTFLGVFGAYGFINPLTALIETNNRSRARYYKCMSVAICGFASGMAPIMALESARRTLNSDEKPDSETLENALKEVAARAR